MVGRRWYFVENGLRVGPISEEDLAGNIGAGRVRSDTLVWSEGMNDWRPLIDSPAAQLLPGAEGGVSAAPRAQSAPRGADAGWSDMRGTSDYGPGRPMGFFEAAASCFSKYATFAGRASRSEYWFFVLFGIVISLLQVVVFGIGTLGADRAGALGSLVSLVFLLPSLSVTVRRLHDTDRSGWWWWIGLIPLIGWTIMLVLLCLGPTPGRNRFG